MDIHFSTQTFFFSQYELKLSCYIEEPHCVLLPHQPLIITSFVTLLLLLLDV